MPADVFVNWFFAVMDAAIVGSLLIYARHKKNRARAFGRLEDVAACRLAKMRAVLWTIVFFIHLGLAVFG